MRMLQLLERYNIETRTSGPSGYGPGSRRVYCRQCQEEPQHKVNRTTYFIDMGPMHEIWSKLLNQPYKSSAATMEFFCFVHYVTFLARDVKETLEMIHDSFCNGGHP